MSHLFNKFRFKIVAFFSILLFLFVSFLLFFGIVLFYLLPPVSFPVNQIIPIEKGETLNEVAERFERENLVKSSFLFETVGWFLRTEKEVKAGEYFFEKPLSAVELMKKIAGKGPTEFVKVTVPEGSTTKDIEEIFEKLGFENFYIENKNLEGYLFPDTYFVPIDVTSEQMVKIMSENFEKKTTSEMKNKDVIIMASLLEKEAATEEDRKIISGILWKRLEEGMPLQVDAVFPYIIGKYSLQLTTEDLKIDSPYNTYLYKGLPVGPIANPGLESIKAALEPEESLYWYYLSDKEGNVYYSTTYDQHLTKKKKYLK